MALASPHATLPATRERSDGDSNRLADEANRTSIVCIYRDNLVALNGFIKKTRTTPDDLQKARKRQKELSDE